MSVSIRQSLVKKLFAGFAKNEAKLHKLSYLFWECTLRCNLNCLHCGSDCKKESRVKDMPANDFIKVLEEIKSEYNPGEVMIVLTGGEPLMRKDLEDCGKRISALGYPWGMVTNGFMLSKNRFDELVKSGLRAITLSMDGLEDNHNWLRGNKNSFAAVENALEIIAGEEKVIHDVVTCVNKRNIAELEEIRNKLINHGVKAWRLFTIAPIGRATNYSELNLSKDEIKYLFDYIVESRKDDRITTSFSCESYAGVYDHQIRDGLFFCRAGINIGSVLADGSVSACPNNNPSFVQGNIYNESFLSIWNNKFESMRNRSWMKNGICKTCKDFKYCNGGAMHLRENCNSEILKCLWHEIHK
ncbi:MAG TPA: TIGR04133 family radical SAM/SPASM protein [Bacteroidales bacterium]|nr:TIGR04133 family radical SAM/SPASM protein [Bacteroidales bacterium]